MGQRQGGDGWQRYFHRVSCLNRRSYKLHFLLFAGTSCAVVYNSFLVFTQANAG